MKRTRNSTNASRSRCGWVRSASCSFDILAGSFGLANACVGYRGKYMVCPRVRPLIYFDLCISRFVITTTLCWQDGLYGHHAELLPSVTSSRGPWRGTEYQTFRTPFRRPIYSRSARNRVRPSWCCSGFTLRPPECRLEEPPGIVLVRNGSPGDRFLTVWKDLPGEEGTRVNFTGLDR